MKHAHGEWKEAFATQKRQCDAVVGRKMNSKSLCKVAYLLHDALLLELRLGHSVAKSLTMWHR